ncbi:hypothetical protein [Aeromicrobium sp. 9AM]|uniref:hypothetical protein n=1 Tax=Aeromicrobium sp. 9AM TaxID=2653126 RepID=UPI0012F27064|nr:hypothetical protein [Aeromicrobium sp. 9AM]VXB03466.1 conserved hypothetical protein [Aeromicrobium sp. 9AM]
MPSSFLDWSPDDTPGHVVVINDDEDWEELERRYRGEGVNRPLRRVFEIAALHGVRSVLVEYRYIDADWRSQHAEFYGATFRRFPSVCHRLHFFTVEIPSDLQDLDQYQDHYRGYMVLRPTPNAPVGRTMISPPPDMAGAVVAQATETVHLFGWPFMVSAMPFISQDRQYLRCAHASLWMVLRHAETVHGLGRKLPKDIHEACSGGSVIGRQVPSAGLTQSQVLDGSTRLGLSMARMPVPAKNDEPDPGAITLYNVVCRYVSSQLPPIVLSPNHAWVVVAWRRTPSVGHSKLTLWRHDDSAGPYIKVDDPYDEPNPAHKWSTILMPLMTKMYIAAERAEVSGGAWLRTMIDSYGELVSVAAEAAAADALAVQTYAVKSTEFKARLAGRGMPAELEALYRFAHMPKYIWVIEAVDRRARSKGLPDVLGEVLIDSTESEGQRADASELILAAHVGGVAYSTGPDHRSTQVIRDLDPALYSSDLSAQGTVLV